MSGSSGKVHGNRRGQANEPLNKAPSLEGLEINHILQSEENLNRILSICEKVNRIYRVI